jgi:hypothetical protein
MANIGNAAVRPIKNQIEDQLTERKWGAPSKALHPCCLQVRQVREVHEGGHPVPSHYVVHLREDAHLNLREEQHGVYENHDGCRALDIFASKPNVGVKVVRHPQFRYRLMGH